MTRKAAKILLAFNNEQGDCMYTSDGVIRRASAEGKIVSAHFVNAAFKNEDIFGTFPCSFKGGLRLG